MPAFPLQPRFDAAVNYLVNGQLVTNVLHYSAPPAAPTTPQMQAAVDALAGRFAPKYKAFMHGADRFEGVELRYLSPNAGKYAVSAVGSGVGTYATGTGANTGESGLPTGDAAIIQKHGDGPVKRANGTMFVSGVAEELVTNGRLNTLGVELLQGVAVQVIEPMSTSGAEGQACTLSRTAAVLYSLTGWNVPQIMGHLRRRRPRR